MPAQTLHALLEKEAAATSSAVFVYDTTPTAPFGADIPASDAVEVFQMQTRAGAGASLVGFVERLAFTSKGATAATEARQSVSVFGSTSAFLSLVPSLLALPPSSSRPALAVQVSAQASSLAPDAEGEPSLVQVPDLESLFEGVAALSAGGYDGAVVLSETAEEAAFVSTGLAQAANGAGHDLVSVFDGLTAGRQLSTIAASGPLKSTPQDLSSVLSTSIPYFQYFGPVTATQVVVVPASTYSAAAKGALASLNLSEVGILVVRVVKPWSAQQFLAAIPALTKSVYVFGFDGQSTGVFHDDVLASIVESAGKIKVRSLTVPTTRVPTVVDWAAYLAPLATTPATSTISSLLSLKSKLATFWSLDASTGKSELVPANLAAAFTGPATGVDAKLQTSYDNFRQGGLQQDLLLLEPRGATSGLSPSAVAGTAPASLLYVSAPAAVFKAYEAISPATVGPETRIILASNWTAEEVPVKLPFAALKTLAAVSKGTSGNLYVVDADKLAATYSVPTATVAELAFWSLYFPASVSAKDIVYLIARTPTFASWTHAKLVEVSSAVRNALLHVHVSPKWAKQAVPAKGAKPAPVVGPLPTAIIPTAAGPNADRTFVDPVSTKSKWHAVAQRLIYPEAFSRTADVEALVRPDLPEKTYVVTVSETRRLTPNTYDRNVFHIEFDLKGTGLKYGVGEALGVHGWNDTKEVNDFLEWYGLDPEEVVNVPVHGDNSRIEQRTVFQLFQQNLDIFGKPGKSFYETLSKYATNKNEERALRFIACPDGHATFKKMSETETVTYADLMRQFPSAKPSIEDLVREIEEIKPRHYSISSSQNFVGDSVHLLVVTVEWQTPAGSPRFGQCTRYLSGLKAGDKVTVSVKPSVMKLPVNPTAPIIMAGLGTGAAPFRAFIQERAWQKAQGRKIGPSLYYFGSRHRSKEYLYGEEIEAYLKEGIVTHAGLAFSRDTGKKVYIQHKINEDAKLIAKSMEEGTFYLCGPTWPVPDLYEALVSSFVGQGSTREAAEARIEELKEAERYVLEVY
ncbi:sulfite reductase (NADPH) flavoprotein alpha-component [Pseudohyphozyma bogoriensis]|nr:sulfite reductase (NADPH) flavoprotein alpha-component [Pseudohyphozyma bogoriensis]